MEKTFTTSENCLEFSRRHCLTVNGKKPGVLVGNESNGWFACFDSWQELADFFTAAKKQHEATGQRFPWLPAL